MAREFYERLTDYYTRVSEGLRAEAGAAAIFPNPGDIGVSRERLYAEFLQMHAPSNCNIFYGGFLFGLDGSESRQVDVIITNDSSPQFNLSKEGIRKAFACIEGAIAVVSMKSTLTSDELRDSLDIFASLPDKEPLEPNRLAVMFNHFYYEDWPFKIIYASKGISEKTLQRELIQYYQNNPKVPLEKRPNLIHVSGKYYVIRKIPGFEIEFEDEVPPMNGFIIFSKNSDIGGLAYAVDCIQERSFQSKFIIFRFNKILTNLLSMTISQIKS